MARASKKDLENSVSTTKNEDSFDDTDRVQSKAPGSVEIYDKAGNLCSHLPKDQIMAACSPQSNTKYHEIRVNIDRKIYDPFEKDYAANSYKKARILGQEPFKMVKCDESTFKMYIDYLRSQNKRFLQTAQRGV